MPTTPRFLCGFWGLNLGHRAYIHFTDSYLHSPPNNKSLEGMSLLTHHSPTSTSVNASAVVAMSIPTPCATEAAGPVWLVSTPSAASVTEKLTVIMKWSFHSLILFQGKGHTLCDQRFLLYVCVCVHLFICDRCVCVCSPVHMG